MKIKKLLAIILAATLMFTIAACGESDKPTSTQPSGNQGTTPQQGGDTTSEPTPLTGLINSITRENGSGTRGAFVDLFDIKDADGKDYIDAEAQEQNSTSQILTSVASNLQSIGYISQGALDATVKALDIDGVAATKENILDGSYKIFRPFNIVTRADDVSPEAQDFINFIMSDEGQAVIEDRDFISEGSEGAYTITATGTVKISGSSSIAPLMRHIITAYEAANEGAKVELQESDSGAGVNDTVNKDSDIGMVSRNVRDTELEQGLEDTKICLDGIALIVNTGNPLNAITSEQVKEIFITGGSISKWEEIE